MAIFFAASPVKNAPVVDYTGKPVANQAKHFVIIIMMWVRRLYAMRSIIMRLRADIILHTQYVKLFSFLQTANSFMGYVLQGSKPVLETNNWICANPDVGSTHRSLINYLDIVYLMQTLFHLQRYLRLKIIRVGAVMHYAAKSPGTPVLLLIEARYINGKKIYKLAEVLCLRNQLYILSNPFDKAGTAHGII